MTVPDGRRRIEALDSLRFLAASVVMITHLRSMAGMGAFDPALMGVLDARAAVALFFVLSGLVLHRSWAGEWPEVPGLWRFYVRRWFRIYPLYYAALLLALVVVKTLPLDQCAVPLQDEGAARVIAADHGDLWQWLYHGLLIPPRLEPVFLVPPVWTLAEEMRVSLIFPWLSWGVARASRTAGLIAICVLSAAAPWLSEHVLTAAGFLPLFTIGAWVAQHHRSLPCHGGTRVWATALAGLALYSLAGLLHWRLHQAAVGAGSALMMLAILKGPDLQRMLGCRVFALGGRCSYGIYILHFPIALAVTSWSCGQGWPAWVVLVAGCLVSVVAAVLLHHAVEQPMIRAGSRLAGRRTSV